MSQWTTLISRLAAALTESLEAGGKLNKCTEHHQLWYA